MARLGGEVVEVFHTPADAATALAHFADPARIIAATEEAERVEQLGDGRLRFHLVEQSHGVYKVKPVYTVKYTPSGDTLTWKTEEGNMGSEGQARFTKAAGGGTDIHYTHRIELDLPVNRMVAAMLQPVVSRLVAPSIRRYVQHMLDGLTA